MLPHSSRRGKNWRRKNGDSKNSSVSKSSVLQEKNQVIHDDKLIEYWRGVKKKKNEYPQLEYHPAEDMRLEQRKHHQWKLKRIQSSGLMEPETKSKAAFCDTLIPIYPAFPPNRCSGCSSQSVNKNLVYHSCVGKIDTKPTEGKVMELCGKSRKDGALWARKAYDNEEVSLEPCLLPAGKNASRESAARVDANMGNFQVAVDKNAGQEETCKADEKLVDFVKSSRMVQDNNADQKGAGKGDASVENSMKFSQMPLNEITDREVVPKRGTLGRDCHMPAGQERKKFVASSTMLVRKLVDQGEAQKRGAIEGEKASGKQDSSNKGVLECSSNMERDKMVSHGTECVETITDKSINYQAERRKAWGRYALPTMESRKIHLLAKKSKTTNLRNKRLAMQEKQGMIDSSRISKARMGDENTSGVGIEVKKTQSYDCSESLQMGASAGSSEIMNDLNQAGSKDANGIQSKSPVRYVRGNATKVKVSGQETRGSFGNKTYAFNNLPWIHASAIDRSGIRYATLQEDVRQNALEKIRDDYGCNEEESEQIFMPLRAACAERNLDLKKPLKRNDIGGETEKQQKWERDSQVVQRSGDLQATAGCYINVDQQDIGAMAEPFQHSVNCDWNKYTRKLQSKYASEQAKVRAGIEHSSSEEYDEDFIFPHPMSFQEEKQELYNVTPCDVVDSHSETSNGSQQSLLANGVLRKGLSSQIDENWRVSTEHELVTKELLEQEKSKLCPFEEQSNMHATTENEAACDPVDLRNEGTARPGTLNLGVNESRQYSKLQVPQMPQEERLLSPGYHPTSPVSPLTHKEILLEQARLGEIRDDEDNSSDGRANANYGPEVEDTLVQETDTQACGQTVMDPSAGSKEFLTLEESYAGTTLTMNTSSKKEMSPRLGNNGLKMADVRKLEQFASDGNFVNSSVAEEAKEAKLDAAHTGNILLINDTEGIEKKDKACQVNPFKSGDSAKLDGTWGNAIGIYKAQSSPENEQLSLTTSNSSTGGITEVVQSEQDENFTVKQDQHARSASQNSMPNKENDVTTLAIGSAIEKKTDVKDHLQDRSPLGEDDSWFQPADFLASEKEEGRNRLSSTTMSDVSDGAIETTVLGKDDHQHRIEPPIVDAACNLLQDPDTGEAISLSIATSNGSQAAEEGKMEREHSLQPESLDQNTDQDQNQAAISTQDFRGEGNQASSPRILDQLLEEQNGTEISSAQVMDGADSPVEKRADEEGQPCRTQPSRADAAVNQLLDFLDTGQGTSQAIEGLAGSQDAQKMKMEMNHSLPPKNLVQAGLEDEIPAARYPEHANGSNGVDAERRNTDEENQPPGLISPLPETIENQEENVRIEKPVTAAAGGGIGAECKPGTGDWLYQQSQPLGIKTIPPPLLTLVREIALHSEGFQRRRCCICKEFVAMGNGTRNGFICMDCTILQEDEDAKKAFTPLSSTKRKIKCNWCEQGVISTNFRRRQDSCDDCGEFFCSSDCFFKHQCSPRAESGWE